MKVKIFPLNPLEVNTYILHDETNEAVIIDPSFHNEQEFTKIKNYVAENNLTVKHILLTHPHIDHLAGTYSACEFFHLPLSLSPEGENLLKQAFEHSVLLGIRLDKLPSELKFIKHKEIITFGNASLEARYTPGHCDGSLCFVDHANKTVYTGDVLFHGSIGRSDLNTGDFDLLKASIYNELFTLDDEFTVRPGHGGRTSIEFERHNNPFL